MNKNNRLFIFLLVISNLFILNSCQTTKILSIDYLSPAEISFPSKLRKIGVVNNVPSDYNTQEKNVKWNDSKIILLGNSKIATESLAESLAKANYFDEVTIYEPPIQLKKDNYQYDNLLTKEEINELASFLQVDFIVTLENIKLNAVKADYLFNNFIINQLEVETQATIRGYLPSNEKQLFKDQLSDTIFWDLNDPKNFHIKEQQIIEEASFFIGEKLATKLVPQWNTAERLLYISGNKTLKKGNNFIKNHQWDEAFSLWKEFYEISDNIKNQMRAALNIAVYYEIHDSFEESLIWANKALKMSYEVDEIQKTHPHLIINTSNYYPIKTYVEILKKRIRNKTHLDQQMRRFNVELN